MTVARSPTPASLAASARNLFPILAFVGAPAVLTVGVLVASWHKYAFAYDYNHSFWAAGWRVLHGNTLYVEPTSHQVDKAIAFIYPAVGAILLAPFSLLGHRPAEIVFTGLNLAAIPLTLRLLEVRDWRLYGFALLCPPVVFAWHVANVTLLLGLGIAALWRWRENAVVSGVLVATLASVKLFVWPLGLWLLATRRYKAGAYAAGSGIAMNAVAWSIIGWDEFSRYQHLLRRVTSVEEHGAYTPTALALQLGVGRSAAYMLGIALSALIAGACISFARRGEEAVAMALCVALMLVASPLVWLTYFALLLIPLGLLRPTLTPAWLLLLGMWVCPLIEPAMSQLLVGLGLAAGVFYAVIRHPGSRLSPWTPPTSRSAYSDA